MLPSTTRRTSTWRGDVRGPDYQKLGPCRCIGCGELLWYAHSRTRAGWNGPEIKGLLLWREEGGKIHKCLVPDVRAG